MGIKMDAYKIIKRYKIYNDYMEYNLNAALDIASIRANDDYLEYTNPVVIEIPIIQVDVILNYIISEMGIKSDIPNIKFILYELLIDSFIYNRVEYGNFNDYLEMVNNIDIDLNENELINKYTNESIVIDYSKRFNIMITNFYMYHHNLLVDIDNDSQVIYMGISGDYTAGILII